MIKVKEKIVIVGKGNKDYYKWGLKVYIMVGSY